METFTVGPEAGKTYQSKHGYPVVADKSIDNVKPQVPASTENRPYVHVSFPRISTP